MQGVGFRDYAETHARILRLTGYVRNLEDHRTVEVVAEGDRQSLESLIHQLHDGPRMSRIDSVDVEWREATGEFRDFRTKF